MCTFNIVACNTDSRKKNTVEGEQNYNYWLQNGKKKIAKLRVGNCL